MKDFNVKEPWKTAEFRAIANKFCYQYMGEEWPLGPHCAFLVDFGRIRAKFCTRRKSRAGIDLLLPGTTISRRSGN
jgi:hypothetical protein